MPGAKTMTPRADQAPPRPSVTGQIVRAGPPAAFTRANVKFVYASAQGATCTTANNKVVFNVRQVTGQPYLARAFFPANDPSSSSA